MMYYYSQVRNVVTYSNYDDHTARMIGHKLVHFAKCDLGTPRKPLAAAMNSVTRSTDTHDQCEESEVEISFGRKLSKQEQRLLEAFFDGIERGISLVAVGSCKGWTESRKAAEAKRDELLEQVRCL